MKARTPFLLLLGLLVLPLAGGCGSGRDPAAIKGGPSDWFWTGLIAVISLAVGFLIGATMSRSGGLQLSHRRHRSRRRTESGWNRISQRIKDGTSQGLADWRNSGSSENPDWADLSRRIEERVIEEMRKHHD
ncbi:hypothetical protein FJY68_03805 [candidate division WOR-3 bacterium]|uniref:Uncharacterized protein n=1 Tax=candidate division WOR-3 bacterium TaxID=2052148 RepID=A0A937XF72_UNCW3|nr:hypothetical protein [candidate division WOR-3 bacterium]